jgi:hypothetical protein
MHTNRAFLLAYTAVAVFGLALVNSTPADAKPCHSADSSPREERLCLVRSAIRNVVSEAGKQAALAQQAAAQKQAAAKQAAIEKQAAAKQAALAKQASATQAPPANQAPAKQASAPPTRTCLTKEYLDGGAVKFTDTCTGEWAQRP